MAARNYSPQFLGDPHISIIPIHEQFSSSDEDSSATAAAENPPVFFHITATLTTLSSDEDEDDDEDDTTSSSSEDSSATFSTTISLPFAALSEEPILAALSEVNFSSAAAAASFARQILFCARTAQLTCDRIKTLHIEAVLEAFVDELPSDDDDDGVNMGFVPASKEAIEGLRKAAERVEKAETCTVCLEEVAEGTEATRLPCSHWYHMDCIVEWLENNKFCPVCRFEMP